MNKDCCNINVKETEDGYRIDISGEGVKEKCKTVFENCCTEEKLKSCFESCCASKE